jgi:hypothetical protein
LLRVLLVRVSPMSTGSGRQALLFLTNVRMVNAWLLDHELGGT